MKAKKETPLHAQLTLNTGSPLVGSLDPVRRIGLESGQEVILCIWYGEVASYESFKLLEKCPFCGGFWENKGLSIVNTSNDWPYKLREAISHSFDLNEFRLLCFDLNVDYDELSGNIKSQKIVALIKLLSQQGRLNELFLMCIQSRPTVRWNGIVASAICYPFELFNPNGFEDSSKREYLETLNQEASRLRIEGKLGDALQVYQKIKAIDPYYPKIDMNIRNTSSEMGRPYVDIFGDVVEGRVFKIPGSDLAPRPLDPVPSTGRRPQRLFSVVFLTALTILIVVVLLYFLSMGYGG